MKARLSAAVLVFLLGACTAPPEEAPAETPPEELVEEEMEIGDDQHLGGCILTVPTGQVPEDLNQATDLAATDAYPPFTKTTNAFGLILVASDDIPDPFIDLVVQTTREMFPQDEAMDLAKQADVLRSQYLYRAVIPMFVGEPEREDMEGTGFERVESENSVCDIIMVTDEGQVMEVVEHILHYVSDIGLHYAFPDEWGIHRNSELALAMDRAIEAGYYDVEQYGDIDEEEVHFRVLMQEFAYWVISTAWNLQENYGPAGEAEWSILNAEEMKAKMPDLYDMIERTVGTVMAAPSLETLQKIGPTRAEEAEG